jgi:hypothetical protein
MAKSSATKSNKSLVVVAMLAAIDTMKAFPAAPEFNADPIRESLTGAGLPADYIEKAIKDLRYKHETTHGDTQAKELGALFGALLDIEGMKAETLIRAVKASAGIVRKDRVELTDAQKEEVKAARAKGEQISAIAERYKVSAGTVSIITQGIKPNAATV